MNHSLRSSVCFIVMMHEHLLHPIDKIQLLRLLPLQLIPLIKGQPNNQKAPPLQLRPLPLKIPNKLNLPISQIAINPIMHIALKFHNHPTSPKIYINFSPIDIDIFVECVAEVCK